MIQINLLPIEKRQKAQIMKQNLGFLIFCLSMMVILGIIIVVLIGVRYTFKAKLDGLNSNIQTSKSALSPYQDIKDKIFFIKDRLNELEAAKSKRTLWSQNLAEITKVMPENMQLTEFTIDSKTKDKPPVKIIGLANSQQDIIRFKDQLAITPYFKDVNFDSSKKVVKDDKDYINFTLSANLEDQNK